MRVRVALLRQPAARVVVVVTRPALGHEGPDVRQQRGNEDAPVGDGHAVSPGGGGVAANTTQIGRGPETRWPQPSGWDQACLAAALRSEEHTSELQSLMRISYAVFCLKKKKQIQHKPNT